MRETKYTCDLCGVDTKESLYLCSFTHLSDEKWDAAYKLPAEDLCVGCATRLHGAMVDIINFIKTSNTNNAKKKETK